MEASAPPVPPRRHSAMMSGATKPPLMPKPIALHLRSGTSQPQANMEFEKPPYVNLDKPDSTKGGKGKTESGKR